MEKVNSTLQYLISFIARQLSIRELFYEILGRTRKHILFDFSGYYHEKRIF